MSIFKEYKAGEMLPIIKNAELIGVPFKIEKMKFRQNVPSDYGVKDQMICSIAIVETGERFTYFAENAAVLSKLVWMDANVSDWKERTFVLFKTTSATKNEYYDIDEYEAA